jgi:hypothetical protein
MPSIRLGRFINAEQKPQEYFLLAKEQISISGSVIKWSATQLLPDRQTILGLANKVMETRIDTIRSWIEKEDLLGCIDLLVEWCASLG